MISFGIYLAERGLVPDSLLRLFIKQFSLSRLTEAMSEDKKKSVIDGLNRGPIAENTIDANEQHYEVPADYFKAVLGPRLKYSCCLFDDETTTLGEAEIEMMELYLDRAQIEDGQTILDLGCGWGSLSSFLAERFPNCNVYSVSNSKDQIEHIENIAKEKNLKNIHPEVQDVNSLSLEKEFDRVVSIEMFEHMRNYKDLLEKVKHFLKPDGLLFIHIFCHKETAYLYEESGEKDWMTSIPENAELDKNLELEALLLPTRDITYADDKNLFNLAENTAQLEVNYIHETGPLLGLILNRLKCVARRIIAHQVT